MGISQDLHSKVGFVKPIHMLNTLNTSKHHSFKFYQLAATSTGSIWYLNCNEQNSITIMW